MYLVIGKSGQLASELKATMGHRDIIFLGRNDIDLFSYSNMSQTLDNYGPDVIINSSAYTDVDGAESNKQAAFMLNELAVRYLADYCAFKGARFIHTSTDFVFDGTKSDPYEVDDNLNPLNIYGLSKLGGEIAIRESDCNNYSIVRTSWLYSAYGKNFVKTMINLMNSKQELRIVDDQIGCPTHAKGLARFIWFIADQSNIENIYHWSDLGQASWFEFAIEIYNYGREFGLINKVVKIRRISSSDYPTPATRPKFSVLKTSKESQTHWRDNLWAMLKEISK